VGGANVAYSAFDDRCGVVPGALPDAEVFAGGTIRGNVCWAARPDDAGSLVMYDSPFLGDDADRVFFALAADGAGTPAANADPNGSVGAGLEAKAPALPCGGVGRPPGRAPAPTHRLP
jgi:hypothetical protein